MPTSMYIKFENPSLGGFPSGEHAGEFEILSWTHGFVQPTGPTRSTGQATHETFSFTKYMDNTTDELQKYSWSGKQIGKATLSCYRSDGSTDNKPVLYLAVGMQHVVISNYNVSGGSGDIPVENVALDYGTIQYTYKDQRVQPSA